MTSSVGKRLAGLLLFLSLLAPQGAAAQEPPKFLIETIVVQGVQRAAGRQIVAEESLLKPGQTYSEQELRQAVYRVKRLPFVVDAEFSLRKGSERGAYELVITVEEATPVFFLADAGAQRAQRLGPSGKLQTTTLWQRLGTLGGRVFVGSHGLAYGSVEKAQHQDGELVQLGYTQYDLFGAGSFASAQLDSTEGVKGLDQYRVSLIGGVPLTAAQSLRATLFWGRSKILYGNDQSTEEVARLADLAWVYNTTDDPLFPMSGSTASAGVTYQTSTAHFVAPSFQTDDRESSHSLSFGLGGEYFWPLTSRQSIEMGFGFNRQRSSASTFPASTFLQGTLSAGVATSLWGYEKTQHFGDLRFESFILVSYSDASSAFFTSHPVKSASFISSLGYHSRWGVVRLSFTYADLWSDR